MILLTFRVRVVEGERLGGFLNDVTVNDVRQDVRLHDSLWRLAALPVSGMRVAIGIVVVIV